MPSTWHNETATPHETEETVRLLHQKRLATAKLTGEEWTIAAYLLAVNQSSLKRPVKNTLRAMVEKSGARHTTVSRATLCFILKKTRVETITEHWHKAREAGLLRSVQRHNESSIHTFLIPGTYNLEEEGPWGDPWDGWHIWTPEEEVWWDSLDGGEPIVLPWGDGRAPF